MPAKVLIARTLPVPPLDSPDDVLWEALEQAAYDTVWEATRDGEPLPAAQPRNLTHLTAELTKRMLTRCNFCRWHCHVDRSTAAKYGACQLAGETRVGSYFHHRGEELVFRGRDGSGTIFFTSCNMRCSFCQNGDISTDKLNGSPVTAAQLAAIARQLRLEGCHNVNWVGGDPTIHLHTIVEALSLLEDTQAHPAEHARSDSFIPYPLQSDVFYQGQLNVPMLWNSNFFMSEPAMKVLRVLMDAWLPDFKFGPGPCAVKLSRTPWYWETVTANLKAVYSWGESMAIRHLVMPGHVECCTFPVLEWIAEHMPDVPVNVMDQYHPDNQCDPRNPAFQEKYRELSRGCTSEEILAAYRRAAELKLEFGAITFEKSRGRF